MVNELLRLKYINYFFYNFSLFSLFDFFSSEKRPKNTQYYRAKKFFGLNKSIKIQNFMPFSKPEFLIIIFGTLLNFSGVENRLERNEVTWGLC